MRAIDDETLISVLEKKSVRIPESGCWIWICGLDKDGYGQAMRQGCNIRAHRLSWLLHRGNLRAGYVIMHICDVRSCINPDHLEQALQIENNNDKMRKNRHRVASGDAHYLRRNPFAQSGSKGPSAKITEQQAIEIRARFAAGELQKALSSEFGITRSAISGIVTRRTFAHI